MLDGVLEFLEGLDHIGAATDCLGGKLFEVSWIPLPQLGKSHDDGESVIDVVLENAELIEKALELFAGHLEISF